MRHIAAYTEITAPRFGTEEREYSIAKHHPPYVYGTGRNNCLIHKINYVKLRWWTHGPRGDYLVRLQSPHIFAVANCGAWFALDGTKAKSCTLPRPDAVLCAKCHGEGTNFPHGRPHKVSRGLARVRLGCIAEAA
jgi:hypothetical protein